MTEQNFDSIESGQQLNKDLQKIHRRFRRPSMSFWQHFNYDVQTTHDGIWISLGEGHQYDANFDYLLNKNGSGQLMMTTTGEHYNEIARVQGKWVSVEDHYMDYCDPKTFSQIKRFSRSVERRWEKYRI